MKFALQLYSIRDCYKTGEEFLDALGKIKRMGYDGVEFSGFAGLGARELKAALEELGLTAVASHERIDRMGHSRDEVVEFNRVLGCANIVCAYSPAATEADMQALERDINAIQEIAVPHGIHVLYHNHAQEFSRVNGQRPIDRIKRYCILEPDAYWISRSGYDPIEFLRENAELIGLVHLKDGTFNGSPCPVGDGQIDIAAILAAAEEIGTPWVIVENDCPSQNGLDDAARSLRYIRAMRQ